MAGPGVVQFEAGFELVVRYDVRADRDGLRMLVTEDCERLVWEVEMDTGWPAGTREVQHEGTTIDQSIEGDASFYVATLTYRAIYERTMEA